MVMFHSFVVCLPEGKQRKWAYIMGHESELMDDTGGCMEIHGVLEYGEGSKRHCVYNSIDLPGSLMGCNQPKRCFINGGIMGYNCTIN